jgi:hypothetical protein
MISTIRVDFVRPLADIVDGALAYAALSVDHEYLLQPTMSAELKGVTQFSSIEMFGSMQETGLTASLIGLSL